MALKVGIQLYSVRDEMKKDPINAIRQVAEIGYKNLEFASSNADTDPGVGFGVSVEDMQKLLKETGANLISGHIRPINEETIGPMIAYHTQVGTKYLGQSADFYTGYDQLMERCEYYNWAGKKLSEHGIKFLIHNHYHEFQKLNGKEILFHIMDNTDPNYVSFELDTFWAMWTVNDPNVLVTWDSFGKGSDHKDFCEIGTGIMDIQSIINKGNELGAEYIVLEQDHTQLTQMESVRISMDSFHKFSGLDW